jgi:hypothetical protein
MKKKKIKQPIMRQSHLPLILLGAAMALYGLVSALVWSVSSSQAMRGVITAGQLRVRLQAYEDTGGLIAGIVFFVLFVWCAVASKRGPRAAFIVGAFASFAPILAGRADDLLFGTLKLVLPAGSVIAGALSTIVFTLPMVISFIILASSGRVPRACRWLAFATIFIVLATAFFPIYVTVLAFLLNPGDPAVGRMLETSTKVIKLRYLLPGLSLLLMAYFSLRFAKKQQPADPAKIASKGEAI